MTGAGDGQSSLTLSGSNTLTGGLTVTHENDRILLGTEDKVGVWAGATLGGAGTLVVVNGSLSTAMSNAEGSTARIGVSAGENKTISLGGTSSDMLTFITLGTGSVLSGVTGDIFCGRRRSGWPFPGSEYEQYGVFASGSGVDRSGRGGQDSSE